MIPRAPSISLLLIAIVSAVGQPRLSEAALRKNETMKALAHRIAILFLTFVGVFGWSPLQSAAADNLIENFPAGRAPIGLAFDGTNIWVASHDDVGVTKLRASDG